MAATGRNLLLELRIKATAADRNLLSNIHTLDANRGTKLGPLLLLIHSAGDSCGCCLGASVPMQLEVNRMKNSHQDV